LEGRCEELPARIKSSNAGVSALREIAPLEVRPRDGSLLVFGIRRCDITFDRMNFIASSFRLPSETKAVGGQGISCPLSCNLASCWVKSGTERSLILALVA
jgi:hypothetical protein